MVVAPSSSSTILRHGWCTGVTWCGLGEQIMRSVLSFLILLFFLSFSIPSLAFFLFLSLISAFYYAFFFLPCIYPSIFTFSLGINEDIEMYGWKGVFIDLYLPAKPFPEHYY